MERKVASDNLKIGMYVSNLDRPWLDTPFLMQGIQIKTVDDINEIQKFCKFVYIDTDHGVAADIYLDSKELDVSPANDCRGKLDVPITNKPYQDEHPAELEMSTARKVFSEATDMVRNVLDILHSGKELEIDFIKGTIEPMVDSVVRNPDALLWLSRLKEKDFSSYSQSVTNTALAIAFGRHLNLPRNELKILATGVMLLDVGKVKIRSELLNKTGKLTTAEFEEIKEHVKYSVESIQKINGISSEIIQIVNTHHERHDRSGYPNQIGGNNIPVYGRMAAIVDCYVAMTSPRPYRSAMSPYKVIRQLYSWRDTMFQHEVVEQFIQCLGAYPVGSIVELSTGEIGVILSQNRTRILRPKIMIILSAKKEPYEDYPIINLMTMLEDNQGKKLEIVKGVNPDDYNIDLSEFYLE